jgi:hypothetical protein
MAPSVCGFQSRFKEWVSLTHCRQRIRIFIIHDDMNALGSVSQEAPDV